MGQEFSLVELTNALMSDVVAIHNGGYFDSSYWKGQSAEDIAMAKKWLKDNNIELSDLDDSNTIQPQKRQVALTPGLEPSVPEEYGRNGRYKRNIGSRRVKADLGQKSGKWDRRDDEYADLEEGDSWDDIVDNARRRTLNARKNIKNRRACWKKYAAK